MKHKHHIIPRHMGGTDDPSNLVDLTIEEHAKAHRQLWEQYGKKEDYIAWLGLSKTIDKKEVIKLVLSMAGKKSSGFRGRTHSDEHMDKLKSIHTGNTYWLNRSHKDETKKLIGQKNSVKQKGKGNSQYGTCWITNGVESKKINKNDSIPEGWYRGRKIGVRVQPGMLTPT